MLGHYWATDRCVILSGVWGVGCRVMVGSQLGCRVTVGSLLCHYLWNEQHDETHGLYHIERGVV